MSCAGELAALALSGDLTADRELTRLAAVGDFQAQRELLTILIGDPDTLYQRPHADAAGMELLARFIALRGDALDVRRLAGILWQIGRTAPAEDGALAAAEAVKLLRGLADGGDGVASEHLAALAEDFPDEWAEAEHDIAPAAPPPIVRTNIAPPPIRQVADPALTLGGLLAEALERQPPRGLFARIKDTLDDWWWRVKFRLTA